MGGHENLKFDFTLVTTYLPIVSLCTRASFLVIILYFLMESLHIPFSCTLMITACLIFLDTWLNRQNIFDSACGHLYLCALAIVTQPQKIVVCTDTVQLVSWVVDLIWCSSYVVKKAITISKSHYV